MSQPSSEGFVARLEALRGIAALAVAIFHAFIWISFGEQRALFTERNPDECVENRHCKRGNATQRFQACYETFGARLTHFMSLSF